MKRVVILKSFVTSLLILSFVVSNIGGFGYLLNNPSMMNLHVTWSLIFSIAVLVHLIMNAKIFINEISFLFSPSDERLEDLKRRFPVFYKNATIGKLRFKGILSCFLFISFMITSFSGLKLMRYMKFGKPASELEDIHTAWGLAFFFVAILHFLVNLDVFTRELGITTGTFRGSRDR